MSVHKLHPDLLIFYRGGGMIRCEKYLVSKTERSANQSEGCDAKRCASHLAGAALFSFCLGAFRGETGSIDD